jgi:PTH1 family peptidyl-tRNA hydrolase
LKPQTFVNLIGESVLYIASFLRINVRDILCVVEDTGLSIGELRVDYLMSSMRHAGIESMTRALKSDRFAKVRVGVGSPPSGVSMESYLLQDFTDEENLILIDVLNKAEKVVKMLVNQSIEEVQNKYNPEGAVKLEKRKIRKIRVRR